MPRRKKPDKQALKYKLETRVAEEKYKELQQLLGGTMNMDMSSLLRHILNNKPIKVYTYDRSLDVTMEELVLLRNEIRAIGININQITHQFHKYSNPKVKAFYAKIAIDQFISTKSKIDQLIEIISKIAKHWLSR